MKVKLNIPKDQALVVDVEKEGTFLGLRYGFIGDCLYLNLNDVINLLEITDFEDILAGCNIWWYGYERWVYLPVALIIGFRGTKKGFRAFFPLWQKFSVNKDILRRIHGVQDNSN